MLLPALLLAAQAANVPELPTDIPVTATKYSVTMMGLTAGQHAVWSDVRKAVVTVKDGVVYRPAELYGELGVRP
jgi:hypothetical protein